MRGKTPQYCYNSLQSLFDVGKMWGLGCVPWVAEEIRYRSSRDGCRLVAAEGMMSRGTLAPRHPGAYSFPKLKLMSHNFGIRKILGSEISSRDAHKVIKNLQKEL